MVPIVSCRVPSRSARSSWARINPCRMPRALQFCSGSQWAMTSTSALAAFRSAGRFGSAGRFRSAMRVWTTGFGGVDIGAFADLDGVISGAQRAVWRLRRGVLGVSIFAGSIDPGGGGWRDKVAARDGCHALVGAGAGGPSLRSGPGAGRVRVVDEQPEAGRSPTATGSSHRPSPWGTSIDHRDHVGRERRPWRMRPVSGCPVSAPAAGRAGQEVDRACPRRVGHC